MLFADIQLLFGLLSTFGHFWVNLNRKPFLLGFFYLSRIPSLCFTDLPSQLFVFYIQFLKDFIIFFFLLLDEHVRSFEGVDLLSTGNLFVYFSEFVSFIVHL